MENKNLNVLDEMNKGCTMGMDAISFVNEKVEEDTLRKTLNLEYNKYKDISRRINNIYNNYSNKKPHETNSMNKMMTWYGVQMKTMSDHSNSNIAELLLNGTNMGIIEGRRLINNNNNLAPDVQSLLYEYVQMQEDSVEELKTFL
jgi:hypothetical protein